MVTFHVLSKLFHLVWPVPFTVQYTISRLCQGYCSSGLEGGFTAEGGIRTLQLEYDKSLFKPESLLFLDLDFYCLLLFFLMF